MALKKSSNLRSAFKEAGVRLSHVAERLGVSRQNFDYLLERGPTDVERKKLLSILRQSQRMLSYIERELR